MERMGNQAWPYDGTDCPVQDRGDASEGTDKGRHGAIHVFGHLPRQITTLVLY